ncbi:hypothetical protein D0A37_26465 [Microcoleus vaginatus HSN003]|nr:hypothetical protein D0A37_26465 [Microcoleus vaginatus HSN003]
MLLHRGVENIVAQGLWGTETACQVGLSRVYDLDKWRGAGISKSSRGCARAVLVESASGGCHLPGYIFGVKNMTISLMIEP